MHPFSYNGLYDAVIIGAGGAGMNLLLALHLSGYLKEHKVTIYEPSRQDINDRTWCFWARQDDVIVNMLRPVIAKSWEKIALCNGNVQSLAPFRYYQINGLDFYEFVKESISPYQLNWIPESVCGLMQSRTGFEVISAGGVTRATKVFDSRLSDVQQSGLHSEQPLIWQSFYGWRVRCKRSVFDSSVFTMMDFDIDQDSATQFIYILPKNEQEGLIELTRFSAQKISKNKGKELLNHWIRSRFGEYDIIDTEIGNIPMSLKLAPGMRPHDGVIPIGTAAGAVKPTTGYAFKRMFYHSRLIADALSSRRDIPGISWQAKARFYDSLLIHILKTEPDIGKRIFTQLFNKNRATQILRFLDEQTTIREEIPLLASLPFKPFLKSLYQVYLSK